MEISKHPEMGSIISSIRKIAEDIPCDDCKELRDDLNAAKSRMIHWKEKYDKLKDTISDYISEVHSSEKSFEELAEPFFEKINKCLEDIDNE
jgi:uncharacterized coiled-coil DUF342 family protein